MRNMLKNPTILQSKKFRTWQIHSIKQLVFRFVLLLINYLKEERWKKLTVTNQRRHINETKSVIFVQILI